MNEWDEVEKMDIDMGMPLMQGLMNCFNSAGLAFTVFYYFQFYLNKQSYCYIIMLM